MRKLAIPALMFLSHLLRRESPRALGFEVHNVWDGLTRLTPVLMLIALPLLAAGIAFGTIRHIGFAGDLLALALYLPWGLAQQYALNGYFLSLFDAVLSKRAAALLAALLFSAVHAPNPLLKAVTLPLAGAPPHFIDEPTTCTCSEPRTPSLGCYCSWRFRTPSAAICEWDQDGSAR